MGYRRKREDAIQGQIWKHWLERHQAELIHECGVPLVILETESRWGRFLEDGGVWVGGTLVGDYYGISDFTHAQRVRLCQFLRREMPELTSERCVVLARFGDEDRD